MGTALGYDPAKMEAVKNSIMEIFEFPDLKMPDLNLELDSEKMLAELQNLKEKVDTYQKQKFSELQNVVDQKAKTAYENAKKNYDQFQVDFENFLEENKN